MAEKPDIVLDESTVRIRNAGSPPVLDVEGGDNWNLSNGDGDLRIGNEETRLAIGVALGGGGMGTSRLRAKGGTKQLKLGAGESDTVTIKQNQAIVDGHTTLGGQAYVDELLQVSGDAHLDGDIELDGPTSIDGGLLTLDRNDLEIVQGTVRLDAESSIAAEGLISCGELMTSGVVSSLVPNYDVFDDLDIDLQDEITLPSGPPTLGTDDARWDTVYAGTVNAESTTTPSDRRLKTDIEDFKGGLDAVLDLRPVSYSWRDNGDETTLGLIGQEVTEVLPEIVDHPADEDGYLSLDYTELIPVLVDALQDHHKESEELAEQVEAQQERIESQQERIEAQQERIEDLEERLSALEGAI